MQLKSLLPLALASSAVAQSSMPSLADALASQNASLSVLNGLLATQPDLVKSLSSASNVTILAPNNAALSKLLNSSMGAALATNKEALTSVLMYHVLNGTHYGSDFTNASMFVPTMLNNPMFSNVTGGQRVEAKLSSGKVTFFSALKENSTVVTPNLNFTGGVIHIIDSVLSVPMNDSATLVAANLTAAAGAIKQAGLGANLTMLKDVTILAPSNQAFAAIGSLAANLTTEMLSQVLLYHVIPGVDYSPMIKNGTMVKTAGGMNVTFTVDNGTVYANSAKVVLADVLVSNGVVHVIDGVLNPQNSTAKPNPSASTQEPAFTGASSASGGGVPFTSGIPVPTSTAPAATGATSSTKNAAPMMTGAVGAAALFGGAAVLVNL
ncbi:uncharacterized protein E0L32_006723 [Thyridium curvatum]|uniref:FAS1 domain-containing protein n=1 Tax=Thyridium curvatum TaxID=1093900 RepID=A0A507AYY6_9PEZI|nr:uncharacterized protein E0L32_006723 [Thyridium curvatum]TPX12843.1 hypothetical protein E0L32_006723 [Thyridium curvatum]